ncbi:LuxR C-terminal-related transcriptional regulator [Streptomyces sp. NPDC003327]
MSGATTWGGASDAGCRHLPVLYDRDAELAVVARLSAAGGGVPAAVRVVCVTGDPGEGRTSLLAHAARDFTGAAHLVAAPSHRVPWSGARALFAALAPTGAAARRALRTARGGGGAGGLGAAVAGLVGDGQALVCLDDLHLWDAHSRAALTAAWREPGAAAGPAWLVSTARHHRLPDEPGVRTVRLGRLTGEGARALLGDVAPVPPAVRVADRLLAEAAGHPGVLTAAVRRLSAARLTGAAPLPDGPVVDGAVLAEVYGGFLDGLPADSRRLLAAVALACRVGGPAGLYDGPEHVESEGEAEIEGEVEGGAGAGEGGAGRRGAPYEAPIEAVLARARAARVSVEALDGLVADGLLLRAHGVLRFEDPFLRRALLAADHGLPGRALPGWGERHRADRLGPPTAVRALTAVVRGRAQLVRGLAVFAGGPVMDAHEAFLQAAELLGEQAPVEASDARFLAMEAAWAAGDVPGCLAALDAAAGVGGTERDFLVGLRAALTVRLDEARSPLARVVALDGAEEEPRLLLRAGSAALVLGDTAAAARVHARALARARAEQRTALLPRALEHLAYAELRAGRYSRAARTAREGLRAAELTGQRNVAAHQHAVLALVSSVVARDGAAVVEHAGRALAVARPHGLAQATTLAEWALARAELGRGLAAQAAARLFPLVRPGPRGGHFALRMLAVPCFVEAAVASGREAEAREATEEYALWAACGVDGPAPAQLARCRALLAGGEEAARWFGVALRHHEGVGNDFERARTLLAYGTWLRRRRRPGEARGPLRDALVTFERAAAEGWAEHARSELRATGATSGAPGDPSAVRALTPQQQRIARLVAEGATNQEVADRLTLSPRTVDHHLRSVFARLGIRSRVELPAMLDGASP